MWLACHALWYASLSTRRTAIITTTSCFEAAARSGRACRAAHKCRTMHRAGRPRAEAGREHSTLHSPPPPPSAPALLFCESRNGVGGRDHPPPPGARPLSIKVGPDGGGSIKRAERHQTQAVRRWSGAWSAQAASHRPAAPVRPPASCLGPPPDRKPGTSGRARARPTNPRTSAGQWAADRASAPWSPNSASAGEVRTL